MYRSFPEKPLTHLNDLSHNSEVSFVEIFARLIWTFEVEERLDQAERSLHNAVHRSEFSAKPG
jgi:hypothetical protein